MTASATLRLYQFTQTDPLDRSPGSPWMSAYAYGANNPLVYIDPTGRRELKFASGDASVIVKNPIAEYDPEAVCRERWQQHLNSQSDFGAGAGFIARATSDAFTNLVLREPAQSCVQSTGNFKEYRAADYVAGTATACGTFCVFGTLILTRYSHWWFSGDFGANASLGKPPRHLRPGVAWDGGVTAGWFNRDLKAGLEDDSSGIDRSIQATSGSAALGIPTGGPVNVSVGTTTATGNVNGVQFGVSLPGPPSFTLTSNWQTFPLNPGSPSKKLW